MSLNSWNSFAIQDMDAKDSVKYVARLSVVQKQELIRFHALKYDLKNYKQESLDAWFRNIKPLPTLPISVERQEQVITSIKTFLSKSAMTPLLLTGRSGIGKKR